MESRKNRVSVAGLRKAEGLMLGILTQDVVRLPLGQIDRGTLADIIALSEVPEQLPKQLADDLVRFSPQMFREVGDLPDGPACLEFLQEIAALDAARVPATLRACISEQAAVRKDGDVLSAIARLEERFAGAAPEAIQLPAPRPAAKPSSSRIVAGPVSNPGRSLIEKVAPPKPRGERRAASTPAAQVDNRRGEWVQEDVLDRLKQYAVKGLGEAVLVAGARHRSPWKDLGEPEVLAVLRRLGREGKVRFSAGRWYID